MKKQICKCVGTYQRCDLCDPNNILHYIHERRTKIQHEQKIKRKPIVRSKLQELTWKFLSTKGAYGFIRQYIMSLVNRNLLTAGTRDLIFMHLSIDEEAVIRNIKDRIENEKEISKGL